ncbi:MAG: UDP-N-acetylmuramoyl-tripeptide--D-alanyl-D-alanine ligase [Bacteroidales bacterium]|nr:UDP-N-acetylmuramoyl-tripeptide--D-alanyl-D-alanine ligase [Bacteroidales bacterium]
MMIQKLYNLFLKYRKISTDTRKDISDTLFFALSGENFNGNLFAPEALNKGAAFVIVDDESVIPESNEKYFLVDNVLNTLQSLAKFHREQFKIPVLGITGSNGKTTTKELVSVVLASEKNIVSTKGNLNNHIGVPLTLLEIDKSTEIAVIEMGANHPGEIKELCVLSQPTLGIITTIGKAHLEGFGSLENIINTKKALYESVQSVKGTVFVPAENELLMNLSENIQRITYGKQADVSGEIITESPSISIKWDNNHPVIIHTQLFGSYNFSNIMAAITAGNYFGISEPNIQNALTNFVPQNNRSQIMQTEHNTLILDAYNANPHSMSLAVEDFSKNNRPNKVIILGDMFEMGDQAKIEHQKIVDLISSKKFKQVILIGKEFSRCKVSASDNCFSTTEEAAYYLSCHPIKNANILIKGSRGMKLEVLTKLL